MICLLAQTVTAHLSNYHKKVEGNDQKSKEKISKATPLVSKKHSNNPLLLAQRVINRLRNTTPPFANDITSDLLNQPSPSHKSGSINWNQDLLPEICLLYQRGETLGPTLNWLDWPPEVGNKRQGQILFGKLEVVSCPFRSALIYHPGSWL